MLGERLDRRIEINVPHGDGGDFQPLANFRAEPRHQQRMRAKVAEEMVLDGGALDLHDIDESVSQSLLGLVLGATNLLVDREARSLRRWQAFRSALLFGVIGMRGSSSR